MIAENFGMGLLEADTDDLANAYLLMFSSSDRESVFSRFAPLVAQSLAAATQGLRTSAGTSISIVSLAFCTLS